MSDYIPSPVTHTPDTRPRHPDGTPGGNGRSSTRFRKLAIAFRTQCAQEHKPCWLDGLPIDYSIPWPDPRSFSIDHAVPIDTNPKLAEDPANFRPSHLGCNSKRGNKTPMLPIGEPSEAW